MYNPCTKVLEACGSFSIIFFLICMIHVLYIGFMFPKAFFALYFVGNFH
jgi:hypothetical protein